MTEGMASFLEGEFSGNMIEGSRRGRADWRRRPFSKGFISLVVSREACTGERIP